MARLTVAEDVLSGQPDPSREPDYDLLAAGGDMVLRVAGWFGGVAFLVALDDPRLAGPAVAAADQEEQLLSVATAVRAVAERYWLVNEAGEELPGAWAVSEHRTPDRVIGPRRWGDGVVVATGTKDGVLQVMGETLVGILREELERLDVDVRVSFLPAGIAPGDLPPWEGLDSGESPAGTDFPDGERFWYVQRSRTRMTTTGVAYFDREYLDSSHGWTRDRADAIRFAEADRDEVGRVVEAIRENGVDSDGSACGTLLPGDMSYEDSPLPPEEIRARD